LYWSQIEGGLKVKKSKPIAMESRVFVVLCIMGLFAILSSTMSKNPVLKPFATSLGAPNDLVGLVASASTIPGLLVSLPAASLSDVFGRKRVLLFSDQRLEQNHFFQFSS